MQGRPYLETISSSGQKSEWSEKDVWIAQSLTVYEIECWGETVTVIKMIMPRDGKGLWSTGYWSQVSISGGIPVVFRQMSSTNSDPLPRCHARASCSVDCIDALYDRQC